MAGLKQAASVLGRDVVAELQRYHVKAQLAQFAVLFLGAFWGLVAAAGFHVAGWAGLGSLLLAAAGAAVRQKWPQISLGALLAALENAKPTARGPLPPPGIATPTVTIPKT